MAAEIDTNGLRKMAAELRTEATRLDSERQVKVAHFTNAVKGLLKLQEIIRNVD